MNKLSIVVSLIVLSFLNAFSILTLETIQRLQWSVRNVPACHTYYRHSMASQQVHFHYRLTCAECH